MLYLSLRACLGSLKSIYLFNLIKCKIKRLTDCFSKFTLINSIVVINTLINLVISFEYLTKNNLSILSKELATFSQRKKGTLQLIKSLISRKQSNISILHIFNENDYSNTNSLISNLKSKLSNYKQELISPKKNQSHLFYLIISSLKISLKLLKINCNKQKVIFHTWDLFSLKRLIFLSNIFNKNITIISSINNLNEFDFKSNIRNTQYFIEKNANRIEKIITNSSSFHQKLSKSNKIKSLSYIPFSVESDKYFYDVNLKNDFLNVYKIESNNYIIGFQIKSFDKSNYINILKSISIIVGKISNVKLVLFSEDPESFNQESLVNLEYTVKNCGIDHIVYNLVGKNIPINQLLNSLDLNIITKSNMGGGELLIHSLLAGVPCIANNYNDSKNLINNFGLVVDKEDSYTIYNAIIQTFSMQFHKNLELRNKISLKNQNIFVKPKNILKYETFYNQSKLNTIN